MSIPLVSIIAICHKHSKFILDTLNSIKNQTYQNIELIIVNNVKDECENIILNWIDENDFINPPIFIQNDEIKTITQNCNLGLNTCTGVYYQPLACDDILVLNKIEVQVAQFKILDDRYACVNGNSLDINEEGELLSTKTRGETIKERYGIDLKSETDYKN